MTWYSVSVLPEADADIREAFLWYRERSRLAADGFRTEIFEAIDDLTETAGVWPAPSSDTRMSTRSRGRYWTAEWMKRHLAKIFWE